MTVGTETREPNRCVGFIRSNRPRCSSVTIHEPGTLTTRLPVPAIAADISPRVITLAAQAASRSSVLGVCHGFVNPVARTASSRTASTSTRIQPGLIGLPRMAADIGQVAQRVMHFVRVGVVCAMLDDVRDTRERTPVDPLAEVDGNRTRRKGIALANRFEGGGAHQVPGHLRRRHYRSVQPGTRRAHIQARRSVSTPWRITSRTALASSIGSMPTLTVPAAVTISTFANPRRRSKIVWVTRTAFVLRNTA